MAVSLAGATARSFNTARFHIPTIEAIEADPTLTPEAAAVVGTTAVVGSLGQLFLGHVWFFITSIAIMLIGWCVWAFLSAFIAKTVFEKETTNTGEMLRTTGCAYAPMMLGVLPFVWFLGWLWAVAAIVVGMRQAGEMTTTQALVTTLIGALPAVIAMGIVTATLR